MSGVTSETAARSATTNHQLLTLSNAFYLHEKHFFWKTKKIVITMMLHLHPNIHHLNLSTLKHEKFLDAAHFLHHVTLDHQSISQSPRD